MVNSLTALHSKDGKIRVQISYLINGLSEVDLEANPVCGHECCFCAMIIIFLVGYDNCVMTHGFTVKACLWQREKCCVSWSWMIRGYAPECVADDGCCQIIP